ncbi:LemA family protein [Weissella kandleri]|uniref:LemA family protein n=1 Tax=Weissella kandleri TaxID=1616 RepID=UPI00387ED364
MLMWIFLGIIVVLVIIYVVVYNGLVAARMHTQEAWSQIDVQLKRRNDLIPNLLETVKGYAKYEQETLQKVVGLRNQLMTVSDDDPQAKMEISNQLSNSLKSIFALSEAYPDLKANQQYQQLMEELTNTENKIAYSRQLFNTTTANYNSKLQMFPTSIVANLSHFKPAVFLETPEAEKSVPKVSFDD